MTEFKGKRRRSFDADASDDQSSKRRRTDSAPIGVSRSIKNIGQDTRVIEMIGFASMDWKDVATLFRECPALERIRVVATTFTGDMSWSTFLAAKDVPTGLQEIIVEVASRDTAQWTHGNFEIVRPMDTSWSAVATRRLRTWTWLTPNVVFDPNGIVHMRQSAMRTLEVVLQPGSTDLFRRLSREAPQLQRLVLLQPQHQPIVAPLLDIALFTYKHPLVAQSVDSMRALGRIVMTFDDVKSHDEAKAIEHFIRVLGQERKHPPVLRVRHPAQLRMWLSDRKLQCTVETPVQTTQVHGFGCKFRVLRSRAASRVFSVSFWKTSVGYLLSLTNSLLFWAPFMRRHFPDWNVRFYIDPSVYRSVFQSTDLKRSIGRKAESSDIQYVSGPGTYIEQVNWHELLEFLVHANDNVELWFYDRTWGAEDTPKTIGTFGSLVRFHPVIDPSIDVAVIRNLELQSSALDADNIKDWLQRRTEGFHVYMLAAAMRKVGGFRLNKYGVLDDLDDVYSQTCRAAGLAVGTRTLLAWCAFNKLASNPVKFTTQAVQQLVFGRQLHKAFAYGVDEAVLAVLIFPQLNERTSCIGLVTSKECLSGIAEAMPESMRKEARRLVDLDSKDLRAIRQRLKPRTPLEQKCFAACLEQHQRRAIAAFELPLTDDHVQLFSIDEKLTIALSKERTTAIQLAAACAIYSFDVFSGWNAKTKEFLSTKEGLALSHFASERSVTHQDMVKAYRLKL